MFVKIFVLMLMLLCLKVEVAFFSKHGSFCSNAAVVSKLTSKLV